MSLKGSKEEFNELRISGFYAARQIQKILLIERGFAAGMMGVSAFFCESCPVVGRRVTSAYVQISVPVTERSRPLK